MMRSSAKRAAYGGLLAASALLFSYVESFVPIQLVVPIPSFKLGLANICVLLAVFYLGSVDGLWVMLSKTVLTAILFGTPTSFMFSLCGSLLAYGFAVFSKKLLKNIFSLIGISIVCACLHNVGQLAVAAIIFKDLAVFWYLGWLLPISVVSGGITGGAAMVLGRFAEKRL